MFKNFKLLIALLLSLTFLSSCASNSHKTDDEVLTTEITDSTRFKGHVEDDDIFTRDGIGRVELVGHIDGDTTYFDDGTQEFSTRYFGINTPESTARVEPWGAQASEFTKSKLLKATDIILERDVADEKTGGRYLGLVWLKDSEHEHFYCLNLLLVEKAFTENLLFDEDSKYFDAFQKAGIKASKTGRRVYGENNDPNYDYSDKVYECTVNDVINNFDDYDLHSNKLLVTGMISNMDNSGIYLTDVESTNGIYKSIYFFTFGATLPPKFTVGTVLKVRCKAHYHNGNMQLTEAQLTSLDEFPPVFIKQGEINFTEVNKNSDFEQYLNCPVTANITVGKMGTPSKNGDVTLYSKITDSDVKLNIRITSSALYDFKDVLTEGNKVKVSAILLKFIPRENPKDFSYQLYVIDNKYSNIQEII